MIKVQNFDSVDIYQYYKEENLIEMQIINVLQLFGLIGLFK